jgi:hypothetical protein
MERFSARHAFEREQEILWSSFAAMGSGFGGWMGTGGTRENGPGEMGPEDARARVSHDEQGAFLRQPRQAGLAPRRRGRRALWFGDCASRGRGADANSARRWNGDSRFAALEPAASYQHSLTAA